MSSTTHTPDRTENRTLAQHAIAEHLRLLEAGEIEAWVELFTPDATFTFPFAPAGMPTVVEGRDALLAHMSNFPETFEVETIDLVFVESADPLVAVAEFGLTGRAKPTGKPYNQRCISVVRTDADGRIVRYHDYWNPLPAIEALQPDELEASGVARSFGS